MSVGLREILCFVRERKCRPVIGRKGFFFLIIQKFRKHSKFS